MPIRHEYYFGSGKKIAICTLSSIKLLENIRNSQEIMKKIVVVGRLFSENKGIDKIIEFSINNMELNYIILCGNDVKGHEPGKALISLKKNGIDSEKRILEIKCPYPILKSSFENIERFRKQIKIIDCIGLENIEDIKIIIKTNS